MKVKLNDVIQALDFANAESQYYYSIKTEEILMVLDGMVNGEDNPDLMKRLKKILTIILHFQGSMRLMNIV